MARKKYMPEKDSWVRDYAGTNKKVDSYIKSQGGNEWDIAGFKRFMDYHTARQNMDVQANNKAVDTWNTSFAKNQQKQQALEEQVKQNQQKRKARQQNLVPNPKKHPQSLWEDLKSIGQLAKETINPFDHIDAGQALQRYADRGLSPKYKEIQRGANRAVDSASFGVMGGVDKKLLGTTPDYLQTRKVGEGGVTDYITSGLGYLVPGTAEYKALNASRVGIGLTKFGTTELAKEATKKEIAKAVSKRLVSEAAKGGIVGLGTSVPEVIGKEILNPKDQNWKDNAKYIAQNTALGAVADPLFYGVGKGFSKGMESASNRTMRNLLPQQEEVQKAIQQLAKTEKGNYALPTGKGVTPAEMQNLIQKGNHITDPNFVASLSPVVKPKVEAPKVLPTVEEIINAQKEITQPIKNVVKTNEVPVNTSTPQPVMKPIEQPLNAPQSAAKPGTVPAVDGERKFFSTVGNSEKTSPEMLQKLQEFDKTYKPMSNQELVDYANAYVKNDMEKAYQFVKDAKKFDPRHITVGHRLIDELQKTGQYDRAVDVVERLAEQGTKAGQSIQSYSIYNRLTPEGQLLRAQRHVNRINQSITDPAKQVKLTEANIKDITHTADSIQRFAGQMEQANNVIQIMDKVKKGKVATDAELETVRSFVSDAKKFFGDLNPDKPTPKVKAPKDIRTRDKVVNFMDKKAEVSREELRRIFGRANSLPVDAFYHLGVIGADKIARGTVKLADFTEEMVKEFGEVVRPYAKQIYNKAVETFNLQSESMTRQRLSEVEKITNKALKDKNLDADQADAIREFARQVGLMSGDAKLESSMELQSILQALETPTFGQRLSAAQTIAQLLNPKTIVRNAIGNELFYRVEQINKLVATPVDILRSKITGGKRTITFISHNQGQYWRNWLTGAKAGWNGVNPMGLTTAYDLGPQAFRSKFNPLTYLEKSLGATLRSFDHAGYMRAYNKTLGEMASLRAINEGLTGQAKKEAISQYIREADENMIQIADQYGKYATFQDNTNIGTVLTKAKRGLNFGKGFGLGDLIIKYPKTPGNLIARALEYSPIGVARSLYMLATKIAKVKDPTLTKEATLALTRGIIGTGGFSILGYMLADKGILTSAGSSDYEVSSLEKNAGKQPNSVNVSALKRFINSGFNIDATGVQEGDTFISYDWAQPISMAIALGTGANQSVHDNGKVNVYDAIKNAGDSVYNTTINMSVLKGIKDFLTSYPNQGISDKLGGVIEGSVGSFVPTISNQARQLSDNTSRTTYSPELLPTIKNKAINRMPSLEKSLPPSYDTLGNKKQTYQNNSNDPFNVLLNPSFVSSYKPSPEAKFLVDFINKTGDKSVAPRIPDKKLDGIALTGEQYAKLQRIMGLETQKGLKQVIPSLRNETDTEKIRKAIKKILEDAGKKAREEIRAERGGK